MTIKRVKAMSYIKSFNCIGGRCPDNCCIGWDVDIDKKTYHDYKKMKNSVLNPKFETEVIKNEDCFDKEIDYGRMVLKSSKRCPFLDDNFLCEIQVHHGEEALSKVCNAYPRVVNLIDGSLELSATISCPEVARLILLERIEPNLENLEMDTSRFIIAKQVNTKDKSLKNHPAKFFNELRDFSLYVMKHSNYTLNEKLIILGDTHHKMMPLHAGGDLNKTPYVIKESINKMDKEAYDSKLNHIKSNMTYQLKFFQKCTKTLHSDPQIAKQRFGDYLKLTASGLGVSQQKLTSNDFKQYERFIKEEVSPFMATHEKMFERYIINSMIESMYPFSEEGDPYAGYTMLIVRLLMIKVLLAGIVSSGEKLTLETVVELIQTFSKTLEHHKTFMNDILQDLMITEKDDIKLLLQLI